MTIEEFAIEVKTLEEYYSKDLNSAQKRMWFDKLKHYDKERFAKAIDFLCTTSRYMPLLSEVMDVVRNQKDREEQKEAIPCKLCKGTGYILYKKKIVNSEYDYACLCVCQNAEGKEYDGTKIADKEHRSEYFIKTAQEVFGSHIPKPEAKKVDEGKDVKKVINNLVEQMEF